MYSFFSQIPYLLGMYLMYILCFYPARGTKIKAPFSICTCETDVEAVHWTSQKLKEWFEAHVCNNLEFERVNVSDSNDLPMNCLGVGPCVSGKINFHFPKSFRGEEAFAYGPPSNSKGSHYAVTGDPSSQSQRGVIYGASALLEAFGVRFFTSKFTLNAISCPKSWKNMTTKKEPFNTDEVPALFTYKPLLEYRQIEQWDFRTNHNFALTLGSNSPGINLVGGGVNYASPPGFVHTSSHIVNITDMYDEHPEWFWPRNKKIIGQLCWSNESLIEYVIQKVRTYLKSQPSASVISVSQNDNRLYCNDTAERAIYDEEGGVGIGPILRAVNRIADAITNDFPNVKVDTLAYQWTRATPKVTKPRKNVIIRLCSIECNFGAPLTDESNKAFQKDIIDWSQISNRTWIWNYVTDFANYVMPWPDWFNISPNINFYIEHNVKGLFQEGAYQSYGGDMAPLKGYLMAKIMFNPKVDGRELIDEFLLGYYGPAAQQFHMYLEFWNTQVKVTDTYLSEHESYHSPYLTSEAILKSGNILKKAEEIVKETGDTIHLLNVQEGQLPTLYVALLRWKEIVEFSSKHPTIEWPFETKLQSAFENFYEIYNASHITRLSENGHDIAWLKKQLNI